MRYMAMAIFSKNNLCTHWYNPYWSIRFICNNYTFCRKITQAVSEQLQTLGHISNVYFHSKIHEYAERLAEKMPGNLKVLTVNLSLSL